jgi:hypothetical protein
MFAPRFYLFLNNLGQHAAAKRKRAPPATAGRARKNIFID